MTDKRKKLTILLIIIILIIALIIIFTNNKNPNESTEQGSEPQEEFVTILEDGTKINKSTKLHETKKIEGLEITQIQLSEKDNVSELIGTITNTSTTKQGGYAIKIDILDKNQKKIITIDGFINKLEPGESTQLNSGATYDCANAYDFNISKK